MEKSKLLGGAYWPTGDSGQLGSDPHGNVLMIICVQVKVPGRRKTQGNGYPRDGQNPVREQDHEARTTAARRLGGTGRVCKERTSSPTGPGH